MVGEISCMPCAEINPRNSGATISTQIPGPRGRILPTKLITVVPWSMMAITICMPSGENKKIFGATISLETPGVQERMLPTRPILGQILSMTGETIFMLFWGGKALNSGATISLETPGAVCKMHRQKSIMEVAWLIMGATTFTLCAVNLLNFWRYSVTMDSWTALTAAPASVGLGADMVFTHSEGGFTPRGNSTDFWEFEVTPPRYDISVQAGSVSIDARYEIDGSTRTILFWDID